LGEFTPTIRLTYGFGDSDTVMHDIVVHVDCVHDDDPVRLLLDEFEVADF
jgi:hypothetical protein